MTDVHMGSALAWLALNRQHLKTVDSYVRNSELGAMGATSVEVLEDPYGQQYRYEISNGGCSLFMVPKES